MLSFRIAKEFGWTQAQAVSFTLSDAAPRVEAAIWRIESNSHYSARSQITLHIDPTMSPKEVMQVYSQARSRIVVGRHRDMQLKHLRLGLMASSRADGMTWRQSMEEWNRICELENRNWKYEAVTNYARDCSAALRRLLHPNYSDQEVQ